MIDGMMQTETPFDIRTPEHVKVSFTDVARKLRVIRVRILRVRQNLHDIDRMINEMDEIIRDIEEVSQQ